MKNILNSAIASKSNSDTQSPTEIKTEKTKEDSDRLLDIQNNANIVAKESSESTTSPSKHVANQSKLFRPPEVQSSSAKSEDKLLSPQNPMLSPLGPHYPSSSMFFPHPYVQLGSMHPLGLPIIHQIPMAMQQYLPSSMPAAAKQTHRPNILRNSPSTSKPSPVSSAHNEQDKMAANALFQQPAHSHRNNVNVPSPLHGKSPAAHSNHKRSHDSLYSPNYNIPSHPKSLSNKSLLFDYEAPKRIKKECDSSTNLNVKQNTAEDDQPQDLSMKTLCKKSEIKTDCSVLDLRQPSTSLDNAMKSIKSEMTLNMPKHSVTNILKTPTFSRKSSPPDVFSNKSPVFSAANNMSSHSSTKVCFIRLTGEKSLVSCSV